MYDRSSWETTEPIQPTALEPLWVKPLDMRWFEGCQRDGAKRSLTNLTSLQLFWNKISDLSPLANLTKLTRL